MAAGGFSCTIVDTTGLIFMGVNGLTRGGGRFLDQPSHPFSPDSTDASGTP